MDGILFINFKTYREATGQNAVKLAGIAEKVAEETAHKILLVVQAVDLRLVAQAVELPVFAQHIDGIGFGSNTGRVLPEAVKEAGASGSIINHAENKVSNKAIQDAVKRAKELSLQIMVCAETTQRAKEVAEFGPAFIAVEPPELIGGDISVSTAQPELIEDSVRAVRKINPRIKMVTGAGVKNAEDVRKAIKLGTVGVFVASGIVKAADPEAAMRDLLSGFKQLD